MIKLLNRGWKIATLALWLLLSFSSGLWAEAGDQAAYVGELLQKKDCYRAKSELIRFRFLDPQSAKTLGFYGLRLECARDLKDEALLFSTARQMAKDSRLKETEKKALILTAAKGLIKANRGELALGLFKQTQMNGFYGSLLTQEQNLKKLDPSFAKTISYALPGSGLLLSKSYQKAALSFVLNAVFLAGSLQAANNGQPALAGLLLFFEIGWYFGGANAAHEAAVGYNRRLVRQARLDWIEKTGKLP